MDISEAIKILGKGGMISNNYPNTYLKLGEGVISIFILKEEGYIHHSNITELIEEFFDDAVEVKFVDKRKYNFSSGCPPVYEVDKYFTYEEAKEEAQKMSNTFGVDVYFKVSPNPNNSISTLEKVK